MPESTTTALVGPLPQIRYHDGTREVYTPPANTMDPRYAACTDHHPACDALAAGRVAWRIAERYPQIAGMSLDALHEAQAMWHRARQADFAAYLVREGKPADDVCGDWPLRVRVAA